jgi:uncharacterized membrane protein YphA (DoxX/SURF4 family)
MQLTHTIEAWTVALVWVARIMSGVILVLSGFGKLFYMRDFRKVLTAYQLLHPRLISPVSIILPTAEVLCGISMFITRLVTLAGFCAVGLFGVFIVAISTNLVRGKRELPCGCFGKTSEILSWLTVLRNLALIGLALLATGRCFALPLVLIAFYLAVRLSRFTIDHRRSAAQPT